MVADGILMREGPETYTLSSIPASRNWVRYHAGEGEYQVSLMADPDSSVRKDKDPLLFRYGVAGTPCPRIDRASLRRARCRVSILPFHPVRPARPVVPCFPSRHGGQPGIRIHRRLGRRSLVKDARFKRRHVRSDPGRRPGLLDQWRRERLDLPTPTPRDLHRPWSGRLSSLAAALFLSKGRTSAWQLFLGEYCATTTARRSSSASANQSPSTMTSSGASPLRRRTKRCRRAEGHAGLECRRCGTGVRSRSGIRAHLRTLPCRDRSRPRRHDVLHSVHRSARANPVTRADRQAVRDTGHAEWSVAWAKHPGPGTASDADLGFPRLKATVHAAPSQRICAQQLSQERLATRPGAISGMHLEHHPEPDLMLHLRQQSIIPRPGPDARLAAAPARSGCRRPVRPP